MKNSCGAYDKGDHNEAIRIAAIARVLLHDTSNSTSLLTLLGKKNINLLSTIKSEALAPTVKFFDGVTMFPGCQPKLGFGSTKENIPVEIWWKQVIMVPSEGHHFARSRIVLSAANKDGGAHIDRNLPTGYKHMKDGLWSVRPVKKSEMKDGICTKMIFGEAEIIPDHNLIALRQIGYELLNSSELIGLCEGDSLAFSDWLIRESKMQNGRLVATLHFTFHVSLFTQKTTEKSP